MRYLYIVCVILIFVMFSGCLDTDFDDPNSQFVLLASLADDDENFEVGGDSVRLLSARFVVNNIALEAVEEDEVFESSPVYVNISPLAFQSETVIGAGEIFGGSYTGVSFEVETPPADIANQDEEMFDFNASGEIIRRYSIVLGVQYNGELYTIRSQETPQLQFGFDRNINMPETLGEIRVNLVGEWKSWFTSQDGDRLLNPESASDRDKILENFKRYFTATTVTVGEI